MRNQLVEAYDYMQNEEGRPLLKQHLQALYMHRVCLPGRWSLREGLENSLGPEFTWWEKRIGAAMRLVKDATDCVNINLWACHGVSFMVGANEFAAADCAGAHQRLNAMVLGEIANVPARGARRTARAPAAGSG